MVELLFCIEQISLRWFRQIQETPDCLSVRKTPEAVGGRTRGQNKMSMKESKNSSCAGSGKEMQKKITLKGRIPKCTYGVFLHFYGPDPGFLCNHT